MRYKIGDVSKILGISTDLLRYYEKKGVVKPEKDDTNGYRYYDTWDMNFLIDCIWYKNFGFGIDQIADISNSYSYENLTQTLGEKQAEIDAAVSSYKLLSMRLEEHRERIAAVKDRIGKCRTETSPEIISFLNRYSFHYDSRAELLRLSSEWMKYMPFLKRYFEIPLESLNGEGDDSAWGFSLDMPYAGLLGAEIKTPVTHYPGVLSIHSAFKSAGKNGFTARHLDYMKDYAAENGLSLCGNAMGNLICSVFENGAMTGYFEVWLPVSRS